MADNYLEKRQEELASSQRTVVVRKHPSLDTLLRRNRSYRGYDPARRVTEEELRELVGVVGFTASGMNRQVLRFRIVPEADKILPHITLGAALPDEHLPKPGMEPSAFLVVCSTVPEDKVVDIDLGFAAQSILLKATEMGLGGIFILNFRKEAVKEALGLALEPVAIIAIGKPAESVFLLPSDGDKLQYYRKEGIHYVPKLKTEHLII
ncbi:MAG: nitroreductase family protein [Bacteroidales bacterium]|nr:nitroreductase family protein [Bacteroidales bacterium]